MQPRVTAILVAHSGAEFLERTLASLSAQTRAPDVLIAVDVASTDASEAMLAAFGPAQLITVKEGTSFGSAVAEAVRFAPAQESDNEWLWLLGHDNAPAPTALAQLLGAVEIAPSVAVAGPKLMRWRQPAVIAAFGETMSTFGAGVALVEGELDQAQHDTQDDVLGVAAAGMLVRRSLWVSLGGFDPGLANIDAALDFSVRARLAGNRVVLVPSARIASAGGPELFGRKAVSDRRRFRLARSAQLHRRLVYAPGWAVLFHWFSLVPLAVLRSIGDLLAKRPGAIGGEFRAAFHAAFAGRVGAARRNLRRTRRLGWSAVAPLRMPTAEVRERRAQAKEAELAELYGGPDGASAQLAPRAGFVAHGGLWVVFLAAVIGLFAYGSLFGANAVSGGGLLPLSETVPELWSKVGFGWRDVGTGFLGAADPFVAVLAVLGSLTFWAPSFSIVLLYLSALPFAALGAWFCARKISRSPWIPAVASLLWALAPPLLSGLSGGHLGAVVAHLLLPWLFLAALSASRSWAAGAAAALLFAGVAASAPSLVPALLLLWVAMIVARPASIHRIVGIPIPAAVLFAPLVVQQLMRHNLLGLFSDPGVPVLGGTASGWRLALSDATGALHGWPAVLQGFAIPPEVGPILVAALLAPLGALALLALFLPGSGRAIPAMVTALLGYLTAVAASHLQVSSIGDQAVTVWPGSGLSLFWLGLTAAAVVCLPALGRMAAPSGVLAALATTALALPLLGAMVIGTAAVQPTTGRILPALVTAEARHHPSAGTLVIDSRGAAGISASVQRGLGATLDDQSTLASTTGTFGAAQRRIAALAGNLASRSGYDEEKDFRELDIRFVVVSPGTESDDSYQRTVEALDANEIMTPVGTTANGLLWRYEGETAVAGRNPGNTDTALGVWILIGLGVVFGVTALLAIPTEGRRGRPRAAADSEEPAGTFDEEDHD
ncbi:MAG TPA: glycosyltransferase family 2 protein [Terrimesophilobacter sp.]|uniref:glycosyltransferase family 2 protein n=1 Tax=Terrimesophilobacter sp. TaxID=2906435 RepID=UPI002F92D482